MFWHEYLPDAIFFSVGPLTIHWYGLILVLAILVSVWQARIYFVKKSILSTVQFEDLVFYIIIFGLLGARLGHIIFFQPSYYLQNPIDIFKIWEGGLAIQGALLFGFLTAYMWTLRHKINLWKLTDGLVLAVPLGQAIGRWGNYFNQELFGKPTDAWWGIPIAFVNRIDIYKEFTYFHPSFFYESLFSLLFFIILYKLAYNNTLKRGTLTLLYFIGYGLIRFFLEFIRIDEGLFLFGMRGAQIISLVFILTALALLYRIYLKPLPKYQK